MRSLVINLWLRNPRSVEMKGQRDGFSRCRRMTSEYNLLPATRRTSRGRVRRREWRENRSEVEETRGRGRVDVLHH